MNTQRWIELSLMLSFLAVAAGGARAASAPASSPVAMAGITSQTQETLAPVAEQRHHELTTHGHVRVDEYYWLRERENPEVIAYLEAENAYTEAMTAHTKALEDRLFEEIRSRIDETDESVPYRLRDYYYYTRTIEGKDYPIFARRRGSLEAPEEVMLDANVLAEGKSFFAIQGIQVSEGQDILAFAVDTVGRRIATIRFKNLSAGEILEDVIPNVTGNMAWAADNRTLFYARQDPNTLRSYRIFRHVLGTDPAQDEIVFEETDEEFRTFVFRTKSREYIVIGSSQTLSDEYRYVSADDPQAEFHVFLPRQRDHEHSIDHFGDHFYIRTNAPSTAGAAKARNFRLARTPVGRTAPENWEEVIAHRDDVLLEGFEIFRDHLVVAERQDGLTRLRVRPWSGEAEHYIEFEEPAYLAYASNNPEIDTNTLRFGYTSLTTPSSVYDYDMQTRERTLRKRDRVLGGYDPAEYRTERLYAEARDGTRVPVSLVYRRDLRRDGPQQLLLYGYGSYGASIDPSFSSLRLSLLDRGFAFAIAHIRGGQELGRQWYEDGKLLNKMNTFTDFIDVAEHLVAEGYTTPDQLYAQGGSAGGLLIGAVINLQPDLFHGAIADVPFVDVVTTMLDETIPLTTFEYDEWGNPNERTSYDYMLSYSPYDNVEAQAYPHLLVTAGLHDSQVQYWEPAKWVARLRERKVDDNRLLLKTNMEAGHGGASGRYRRWREIAFEYAFLLDLAGLASDTQ
ncbi:MAG: S9 family peptidase [Longimicrobiales bacterium]